MNNLLTTIEKSEKEFEEFLTLAGDLREHPMTVVVKAREANSHITSSHISLIEAMISEIEKRGNRFTSELTLAAQNRDIGHNQALTDLTSLLKKTLQELTKEK